MKWFAGFTAVAVAVAAVAVRADEVKSGPQPGQPIGAFDVTKCAGASDDGVSVGQSLCYRCKYGGRPMVMVFTRSSGDKVTQLVKELDEAVAKNSDKQLRAFVNIVGEDRSAAETAAKEFGSKNSFANVPIVVPQESDNGPDNYGINPKAEVTVIVASQGKVTASHGFTGAPSSDEVKQILADVSQALQ
jgi:hypothetical protein